MEKLLNYLKKRTHDNWLIGYDSHEFYCLTKELIDKFILLKQEIKYPQILLAQENPFEFLAAFLAAVITKCPVFLCNPNWRQQEWKQVFTLVQPDLILAQAEFADELRLIQTSNNSIHSAKYSYINQQSIQNLIMIPTGGSSGKIRFAIHTWETLTNSVRGLQKYFQVQHINSFCLLPVYHVSGLMQFIRSFITGGELIILAYNEFKLGKIIKIYPEDFLLSLVPTQLKFILESDPNWLSNFSTVFLGGAPAWRSLLDAAREYKIRLSPTYGMTETASQIATVKPEDFLQGNNSTGQILPHAKITVIGGDNKNLETNQMGTIVINSTSLCLGYYPNFLTEQQYFKTDDLGFLDDQGYLNIIGRESNKIITGGENVFPAEVEAAILATQLVTDVVVVGVPDQQWGEVVVAVYIPKYKDISTEAIRKAIKDKISKFKQPKYWIPMENLPRNQQGKINYQELIKSMNF